MTTEVTMTPAAQEFAARLGAAGCGSDPAVVDAILELVPHLFGSNRRPTGQRGALCGSALDRMSSCPRRSDCEASKREC